jgi:CheY-like chemotaxis protein
MAKILVVDDSLTDRSLAGKLLEKRAGAEGARGVAKENALTVIYADNGQEALAAIPRERPDLIVTDLLMPEMNGLELVEEVKRKHPSLPVILMTAHGSEEIAIRALQQGAASYVPKQKLATDLAETVRDILGVVGVRQERQRLVNECWLLTESHFLLSNDLGHIPALIGHIQENLTRMQVCHDNDLVRVTVALREALSNAIIHGNLEVGSELRDGDGGAYHALIEQRRRTDPYQNRSVHVVAEESRSEAVYVIRDEGPGFDAANLPDPTDPANLDKVSGRGLLLIKTFMDEVRFSPQGNEITMVKRPSH